MLEDRLHFSYTILQMGICSVIPLVLLGFVALKPMADTLRNRLGLICSALILVQVLAMRWNVVIGGQLFSKSMRGLTSYAPSFLGREGILAAAIIFAMPFVVMYVFQPVSCRCLTALPMSLAADYPSITLAAFVKIKTPALCRRSLRNWADIDRVGNGDHIAVEQPQGQGHGGRPSSSARK